MTVTAKLWAQQRQPDFKQQSDEEDQRQSPHESATRAQGSRSAKMIHNMAKRSIGRRGMTGDL